jgi:proline iminopeptidase
LNIGVAIRQDAPMQTFITPHGTRVGYERRGSGHPLVCVPGGPLLAPDYLGTLGGLDQQVELVLFTALGSAPDAQADPSALRCDNLAHDLEALRVRLNLDRLDLLAHSAGANVVLRYAERYPDRVGRLVLVTPSTRAVGITITDAARSTVARTRAAEPWYEAAAAALARIQAGDARATDWSAIAPFSYGRWDRAAAAHTALMDAGRNHLAAAAFGADGAFDPPATRAAVAHLDVPVTVLAGAMDVGLPLPTMRELAGLFRCAELVVQPGAGHFPWLDDPEVFAARVSAALRS